MSAEKLRGACRTPRNRAPPPVRVHFDGARSDLNLAVLLDRSSISFEVFERLQDDLQALNPGRTVDLVVLNRADPLLFKKVTESCRILYGPKRKLHELEMLAFKQYQDHRRYFGLERRYVDRVFEIERR